MTTNPLTLAAVRAIKEEAENLIGNEGVVSPYVIKRTTEAIPALCDSYETLVEALRLVVDSPHEAHNKAIVELLSTIDQPSGEAVANISVSPELLKVEAENTRLRAELAEAKQEIRDWEQASRP